MFGIEPKKELHGKVQVYTTNRKSQKGSHTLGRQVSR